MIAVSTHDQMASGDNSPRAALSGDGRVVLEGAFTIDHVVEVENALSTLADGHVRLVDAGNLKEFDTAGATLVNRHLARLGEGRGDVPLIGLSEAQSRLMAAVSRAAVPVRPQERHWTSPIFSALVLVGRGAVEVLEDARALLAMLGEVLIAFARIFSGRSAIRWVSVVSHLDRAGVQAMPIIALMNFLIGMILAQQGGFYFRSFGAELFVVNLVGVLVSREIGVLITAIMVAGRSGSAFTAEIGSMKMREEVDAMTVIGVSPIDVLVVPRLLALIISLPLLVIVADFAAIAGAWVVCLVYLGFPTGTFLMRLHDAVTTTHLGVGLLKAPYMALVVGLVACVEGFKVAGSADSLGSQTTASVVKGIFLVVVMDGIFASFFAAIGV